MKKSRSSRKQSKPHAGPHAGPAKVGSDPDAAEKFGGSRDFGIPVSEATPDPGGRAKGPEQGTGFSRSDTRDVRTSGVGTPVGPDGSGSGGDLDPDIIGLDGAGGVARDPTEHRTKGPDITEGGSAPFASGPPARGTHPHAPHPAGKTHPSLDTVDHSGGDVTTSGAESSEATNPEIEEIAQESGAIDMSRKIVEPMRPPQKKEHSARQKKS